MKFLLILGAGASSGYGFPLGAGLRRRLLQQLRRSVARGRTKNQLFEVLEAAGNTETEIDEFAERLEEGVHDTIDQFLEDQWQDEAVRRIGRQAVAYEIAGWENKHNIFESAPEHWYKALVDFLCRNPDIADSSHFSVVTFNYERSLEYFLHRALLVRNKFTRETLEGDLLSLGNLVHIHGIAGFLSWQRPASADVFREYGEAIAPDKIAKIARGLVFSHEGLAVGSDIREKLLSSDVVAIIGFGFHPENTRRILFNEMCAREGTTIFATAMGGEERVISALASRPTVRIVKQSAGTFVPFLLKELEGGKLGKLS